MGVQDNSLEKQKQNREQAHETSPEKSTRERADLSLELAEVGDPKKRSIETLIKSLDPVKALSDQKEAREALDTVLEQIIGKAMNAKVRIEEIQKNPLLLQRYASNAAEKIAVKKLETMIANSKEYQKDWQKLCVGGAKTFGINIEAKNDLENGKTPKGHEWMSTGMRVGLIAAGAYGAYKLYQWIKHRNDKDAEESEKAFPFVSAALTTMGIGALVGPERLAGWSANYMGLEFTSDALKRFWGNLKAWKIREAFSSFSFDTNNRGINKASEKLKIDKSFLIDLRGHNYKDFKKFRSDPKSTTMSYAGQAAKFLGIDLSSNIIGTDLDDQVRAADAEEKLYKFIEANESRLEGKDIEKMSIAEILNEFEKLGILDGSGTEAPDESKVIKGDLNTMGSHFPHARAAYEAWDKGEIGTDEALGEVIRGTVDDGGGLIIKDGGLWLGKKVAGGIALAFISSSQIICDTLKNIAGIFTGQKGLSDVAIDYYEDGGLWFMGAGALYGIVKTGTLRGAGAGVWKGFTTSYMFVPRVIKVGKQGAEVAKRTSFKLSEWKSATEAEKIAILRAKAAYHAEEYIKYSEAYDKENSGTWTSGVKEKIYKWIYPGWTKDEMISHGKFFNEARNAFLEKVAKSDKQIITNEEIIGSEQSRTKLLVKARSFATDHPESSLPKIPTVRTNAPKYKTGAEANAARLPKLKLSVNQIDRLKKLGFDEKAMLRMRELKMNPSEVDDMLKQMESDPKLLNAFETLVAHERYPQLFNALRGVKKFALPAAILFTIHEFDNSKDKTTFIMRDASMLAVFASAFKGAEMTVGSKIPNPLLGVLVSAGIATGATFGGSALWSGYAEPMLEKHMPNRDNFWKNTKTGTAISALFEMADPFAASKYGIPRKMLSKMNVTGGVDEETDPLEYLSEELKMVNPYAKIMRGEGISIYDTERLRSYDQFIKNANSALEEAKAELSALESVNPEKETELKNKIAKLETFVDGSWLNEKKTTLVLLKGLELDPANEEFKGMALAKFGEKAGLTYDKIMDGIQKGEREIVSGEMKEMWEYLSDQSINLNGATMQFRDFAALLGSVSAETNKIRILETELAKEGKHIGEDSAYEPEAPREGNENV